MSQTIFYIHGFMSSEKSHKAQLMQQYLGQYHPEIHYQTPRLDDEPEVAIAQLCQLIEDADKPVAVIGSSLGGFYGHYLAEKYDINAVLINPAVAPYELLQNFLGPQTNPYTGRQFDLGNRQMLQLQAIECPVNQFHRVQVWLEAGDELLDYRRAQKYFADCDCQIRQGGDHSYQHFEQDLPNMLQFLLG